MHKKRMIHTFTSGMNMDIDAEMNRFLEEQNATPISVQRQYLSDQYDNGSICNRWVDTFLIYEVDVPNKNWPKLKDGLYYCPKCDRHIDVTKNFCSHCGAKIEIPNMSGK